MNSISKSYLYEPFFLHYDYLFENRFGDPVYWDIFRQSFWQASKVVQEIISQFGNSPRRVTTTFLSLSQ